MSPHLSFLLDLSTIAVGDLGTISFETCAKNDAALFR